MTDVIANIVYFNDGMAVYYAKHFGYARGTVEELRLVQSLSHEQLDQIAHEVAVFDDDYVTNYGRVDKEAMALDYLESRRLYSLPSVLAS
jgi:hypothetical protein